MDPSSGPHAFSLEPLEHDGGSAPPTTIGTLSDAAHSVPVEDDAVDDAVPTEAPAAPAAEFEPSAIRGGVCHVCGEQVMNLKKTTVRLNRKTDARGRVLKNTGTVVEVNGALIHNKKCVAQWKVAEALRPRWRRRRTPGRSRSPGHEGRSASPDRDRWQLRHGPPLPADGAPALERLEYNRAALAAYARDVLRTCPECSRSFGESDAKLHKHMAECCPATLAEWEALDEEDAAMDVRACDAILDEFAAELAATPLLTDEDGPSPLPSFGLGYRARASAWVGGLRSSRVRAWESRGPLQRAPIDFEEVTPDVIMRRNKLLPPPFGASIGQHCPQCGDSIDAAGGPAALGAHLAGCHAHMCPLCGETGLGDLRAHLAECGAGIPTIPPRAPTPAEGGPHGRARTGHALLRGKTPTVQEMIPVPFKADGKIPAVAKNLLGPDDLVCPHCGMQFDQHPDGKHAMWRHVPMCDPKFVMPGGGTISGDVKLLTFQPDEFVPTKPTWEPGRGAVCFLCGGRSLIASMDLHLATCWRKEVESTRTLRPDKRRRLPVLAPSTGVHSVRFVVRLVEMRLAQWNDEKKQLFQAQAAASLGHHPSLVKVLSVSAGSVVVHASVAGIATADAAEDMSQRIAGGHLALAEADFGPHEVAAAPELHTERAGTYDFKFKGLLLKPPTKCPRFPGCNADAGAFPDLTKIARTLREPTALKHIVQCCRETLPELAYKPVPPASFLDGSVSGAELAAWNAAASKAYMDYMTPSCEGCGKTFATVDGIVKHMRTCCPHLMTAEDRDNVKTVQTFSCPGCGDVYRDEAKLANHMPSCCPERILPRPWAAGGSGPTTEYMATDFGAARHDTPKGVVCFLCSARCLIGSFGLHLQGCERRWRGQHRLLPEPPSVDLPVVEPSTELVEWNRQASAIYVKANCPQCQGCAAAGKSRIFPDEAKLAKHIKGCAEMKKRPELMPGEDKPPPAPEGKPKGIVCHLCGERCLVSSFARHVHLCASTFMYIQREKPKKRRQRMPRGPLRDPSDGSFTRDPAAGRSAYTAFHQRGPGGMAASLAASLRQKPKLGFDNTAAEEEKILSAFAALRAALEADGYFSAASARGGLLEKYNEEARRIYEAEVQPHCPGCDKSFEFETKLFKHMGTCCPDKLTALLAVDEKEGPSRGLVCHLCGMRTLVGGFKYHQAACEQSWVVGQTLKRLHERRPAPQRPAAPLPTSTHGPEVDAYNAQATAIYDKSLPACQSCGRTFASQAQCDKHLAKCNPDLFDLVSKDEVLDGSAAVVHSVLFTARLVEMRLAQWTDEKKQLFQAQAAASLGHHLSLVKVLSVSAGSVMVHASITGIALYSAAKDMSQRISGSGGGGLLELAEADFGRYEIVPEPTLKMELVEIDMKSPDPTIFCYLCGKRYGTASILDHSRKCYSAFAPREALKPARERYAMPPPPDVATLPGMDGLSGGDRDARFRTGLREEQPFRDAYNKLAEAAFGTMQPTCPNPGCNGGKGPKTFAAFDTVRKHMKSCCPRILDTWIAEDEAPPPVKEQDMSAKGVVCHMCGIKVISKASVGYHLQKCMLRYLAEEALRPAKKQRPLPSSPSDDSGTALVAPRPGTSDDATRAWNVAAQLVYDTEVMPSCSYLVDGVKCGKSFGSIEKLERHMASAGHVTAEEEVVKDVERIGVACHLCGKYVASAASIGFHYHKCLQLFHLSQMLKHRPDQQLLPPPPAVAVPGTAFATGEFRLPPPAARPALEGGAEGEEDMFADLGGGEDSADTAANSAPALLTVMCCLCGKSGSALGPLRDHVASCAAAWRDTESHKNRVFRAPVPKLRLAWVPSPAVNDLMRGAKNAFLEAWNDTATVAYREATFSPCDRCGKKFETQEKMKRHRNTCKVCPVCKPSPMFAQMFELEKHMAAKHPELARESKDMDEVVQSDYGAVCFLCGMRCILGSYALHMKKCAVKWLSEESLKPDHARRYLPVPPPLPKPLAEGPALVAYNARASAIHQSMMPSCHHCGRSFEAEAKAVSHAKASCVHLDFVIKINVKATPELFKADFDLQDNYKAEVSAALSVPGGFQVDPLKIEIVRVFKGSLGITTRVWGFQNVKEAEAVHDRLYDPDLKLVSAKLGYTLGRHGVLVGSEQDIDEAWEYFDLASTVPSTGSEYRAPGQFVGREKDQWNGNRLEYAASFTRKRRVEQTQIDKDNARMARKLAGTKSEIPKAKLAPRKPKPVVSDARRLEAKRVAKGNQVMRKALKGIYGKKASLAEYSVPTVDCNKKWAQRTSLYSAAPALSTSKPLIPKGLGFVLCQACGKKSFVGADGGTMAPCTLCKTVWYCDERCAEVDFEAHKFVCWNASRGQAYPAKLNQYWVQSQAMTVQKDALNKTTDDAEAILEAMDQTRALEAEMYPVEEPAPELVEAMTQKSKAFRAEHKFLDDEHNALREKRAALVATLDQEALLRVERERMQGRLSMLEEEMMAGTHKIRELKTQMVGLTGQAWAAPGPRVATRARAVRMAQERDDLGSYRTSSGFAGPGSRLDEAKPHPIFGKGVEEMGDVRESMHNKHVQLYQAEENARLAGEQRARRSQEPVHERGTSKAELDRWRQQYPEMERGQWEAAGTWSSVPAVSGARSKGQVNRWTANLGDKERGEEYEKHPDLRDGRMGREGDGVRGPGKRPSVRFDN